MEIQFLAPEFKKQGSGRLMMDNVYAGQNGQWMMGDVSDGQHWSPDQRRSLA